jgi:hypothetical protein
MSLILIYNHPLTLINKASIDYNLATLLLLHHHHHLQHYNSTTSCFHFNFNTIKQAGRLHQITVHRQATMSTRPSLPHYAWAAGHVVVLLTSIYCLLGVVTFRPHPIAYRLSYFGAAGGLHVILVCSLFQLMSIAVPCPSVSWASWSTAT